MRSLDLTKDDQDNVYLEIIDGDLTLNFQVPNLKVSQVVDHQSSIAPILYALSITFFSLYDREKNVMLM